MNVVTDLLGVQVTITRYSERRGVGRAHVFDGIVRAVAFASTGYSLVVQRISGEISVVPLGDGVGVTVSAIVTPAVAEIVAKLTHAQRDILLKMLYEQPRGELTCQYGDQTHRHLVDFVVNSRARILLQDADADRTDVITFVLTPAGVEIARALRRSR